ncbi:hypothetical protein PtA15_16A233 [Puccinia triticina]|uniref:CCHC-type domain-containing protein n=1 Tax=Puccinia triticina TaxID=208348 RepID=A0ABY7D7R1_9BASI|nr:uncharacterized protein PtA15_16A233 [Puccinia triticina]WAQ92327.1 hypothetical protein PtA15_16A233 [Puccinia triticina]
MRADKGKACAFSEDLPEETTFQPRLTDRMIGSSATNWRRTEGPPHVQNLSPQPLNQTEPTTPPQMPSQADIASLIAEMRLQREEERARHHKVMNRRADQDARIRQRSLLDEATKLSAIASAAVKKIHPDCILKIDGSNITEWEAALAVVAFERFQYQHFYTPAEGYVADPHHEKIAREIIHSSVHCDLAYDLLDLNNSAEVVQHLTSKFRVINRAKQLQAWETLKKINLTDYSSLAKAIAAFDRCAKTFIEQRVEFTWDTVMGFIMQSNLNTNLCPVLDRKVDLFMETHESENPISNDILRFWDAARSEQRLAEETGRAESSALKVSLASQTDSSFSGPVSGSVSGNVSGSIEDSKITAMAVQKPPDCYICKQVGHIAPHCPTSRKNTQAQRNTGTVPPPCLSFPSCSVTYNYSRIPYIKPSQPEV